MEEASTEKITGDDNLTKQEVISKMRGRKTFRETGLTIDQVLSVLVEDEASKPAPSKDEANAMAELHQQIAEKDEVIANLKESVKRLRSENKKLRSERE